MPGPWDKSWTGGCQCGAVRFAADAAPDRACICHCRMCQKATGQPFQAFTTFKAKDFRWTRGSPTLFTSSSWVDRGFCNKCGTPLTYRSDDQEIHVSTGALDHPNAAPPTIAYGVESEIPWCVTLTTLPRQRTEDVVSAEDAARFVNHQHPDRDT